MPVDDVPVAPPTASRADRRRARVALVLGLLPLPPLWLGAVPLAVRTMRRVPSGSSTFAVAVAAMSAVFGWMYVSFMVFMLAVTLFAPTEQARPDEPSSAEVARDPEPVRAAGEPGTVPVGELLVGDCYVDDEDKDAYFSVDVVRCTDQHDEQVYSVGELPGTQFPGEDEVHDRAEALCDAGMTDRIQRGWDDDELNISWFAPDTSLSYAGDRTVICLAGTDDGRTASLLDSAP